MSNNKGSTGSTSGKARGDIALGLRVRKLRVKRGLSQDALGLSVGRSEGWVYKVEKGEADPGYLDLVNLAQVFDIAPAKLFEDDRAPRLSHGIARKQPTMVQSSVNGAPNDGMMEANLSAVGSDPSEWLEEMRRRAFLQAMATMTGATAAGWWPRPIPASADQAAITRLRDVVVDGAAGGGDPSTVSELREAVEELWAARQRSLYSFVLARAPIVLQQARVTSGVLDGDDRLAAQALLAAVYQVVTGVLRKMGDLHLAAVAADRAMAAAREHGSAVAWGDSTRFLSLVLGDAGHHDQAVRVCVAAADRLKREGLAAPSSLSIYGQLLLTAAGSAAKGGDRALADEFFDTAQAVARCLAMDANHGFTAFGPTNIGVHRVHAAIVLGDGEAAIRRARQLDLDRLPVVERRAHHLLDVALGYNLINKPEDATVSLLSAEIVGPEEVRYDPRTSLLVEQLRRRGRAISTQLDCLASRLQRVPS